MNWQKRQRDTHTSAGEFGSNSEASKRGFTSENASSKFSKKVRRHSDRRTKEKRTLSYDDDYIRSPGGSDKGYN